MDTCHMYMYIGKFYWCPSVIQNRLHHICYFKSLGLFSGIIHTNSKNNIIAKVKVSQNFKLPLWDGSCYSWLYEIEAINTQLSRYKTATCRDSLTDDQVRTWRMLPESPFTTELGDGVIYTLRRLELNKLIYSPHGLVLFTLQPTG